MRINELKSDSYIVDWFREIKPSDKTKINYLNSMQVYTEFIGKTPEELILEAEADIKAGLLPREKMVMRIRKNLPS